MITTSDKGSLDQGGMMVWKISDEGYSSKLTEDMEA
jgi:hypothetical protein